MGLEARGEIGEARSKELEEGIEAWSSISIGT